MTFDVYERGERGCRQQDERNGSASVVTALAVVALLGSCESGAPVSTSNPSPSEGAGISDAGTSPPPDAGFDAGAQPTGDLLLRRIDRYVSEHGVDEVPRHFDDVFVLKPLEDGGFMNVPLEIVDAGLAVVRKVAGLKYVGIAPELTWAEWIALRSDEVDLGSVRAGRPPVRDAGTSTWLAVNATGVGPEERTFGIMSAPAVNQSGIVLWDSTRLIDWSERVGLAPDLLRPGDLVFFTAEREFVYTRADGTTDAFERLTYAAMHNDIAMTRDATTHVSIELQPISTVRRYLLDVNLDEFTSRASLISPAPKLSTSAEALVHPFSLLDEHGDYAMRPNRTIHIAITYGTAPSPAFVDVANPFPSSWPIVARFKVDVADSGGQSVGMMREEGPAEMFEAEIAPRTGPITGFVARDVSGPRALTPLLEWTAPASGPPDYYSLRFHEGIGAGGPGALLITTDNSVRVPPGILIEGGSYFAVITAHVADGWTETRPWRRASRSSEVTTYARFSIEP